MMVVYIASAFLGALLVVLSLWSSIGAYALVMVPLGASVAALIWAAVAVKIPSPAD